MAHIRHCRERFEAALHAGQDATEEDIAFHEAIAMACGNRFFSMTMTALAPQIRFSIGLVRSLAGRPKGERLADVCREHAAIEQAIAQQAAAAARQAAESHLRGGLRGCLGGERGNVGRLGGIDQRPKFTPLCEERQHAIQLPAGGTGLKPEPTMDSAAPKLPLIQNIWIGARRAHSRRTRLGSLSRYSLSASRLPGFMRNLYLFIYTASWVASQQASGLRDLISKAVTSRPGCINRVLPSTLS
jgi:hypothetical protein